MDKTGNTRPPVMVPYEDWMQLQEQIQSLNALFSCLSPSAPESEGGGADLPPTWMRNPFRTMEFDDSFGAPAPSMLPKMQKKSNISVIGITPPQSSSSPDDDDPIDHCATVKNQQALHPNIIETPGRRSFRILKKARGSFLTPSEHSRRESHLDDEGIAAQESLFSNHLGNSTMISRGNFEKETEDVRFEECFKWASSRRGSMMPDYVDYQCSSKFASRQPSLNHISSLLDHVSSTFDSSSSSDEENLGHTFVIYTSSSSDEPGPLAERTLDAKEVHSGLTRGCSQDFDRVSNSPSTNPTVLG